MFQTIGALLGVSLVSHGFPIQKDQFWMITWPSSQGDQNLSVEDSVRWRLFEMTLWGLKKSVGILGDSGYSSKKIEQQHTITYHAFVFFDIF